MTTSVGDGSLLSSTFTAGGVMTGIGTSTGISIGGGGGGGAGVAAAAAIERTSNGAVTRNNEIDRFDLKMIIYLCIWLHALFRLDDTRINAKVILQSVHVYHYKQRMLVVYVKSRIYRDQLIVDRNLFDSFFRLLSQDLMRYHRL